MKEYRKRFVHLNMLLIGIVLLLMVAVIAVYMYQDYYDGLRTTMEHVVEPLDSFSAPPYKDGSHSVDSKPPTDPEVKQPEHQKGIMAVFYTPEKSETAILSQNAIFDEAVLSQILEAVITQEDDFGTLWNYHTIYYRTGNGAPYKIALASTDYIGYSMISLILALFAIWVGAMLCFLLVSIQLSKVAVQPMEEAMGREKQFIADASHDLKTPLSVILANNSILQENPQATVGTLSKWIDSTQNAAKNMQQLIGEMLTLADAERRDAPLTLELVDVSAVVMKAVLQLESVAYEKNVMLEAQVPDEIMLRTNEDYLQRIATSLVENAIKYEPDGGEVQVRLAETKRWVQLEIQNRSTVISKEDLLHIFDRFYRGDKSRQGEAGGHGLGLAITKNMVERMGGQISVNSDPTNGTIFSVFLSL